MARWHRAFAIQLLKMKVDYLLANGDACKNCGGVGEVLHHKTPLETARTEDEARFLALDPHNVVWWCQSCHVDHHRTEYAARRRTREVSGPAAEYVGLVEELMPKEVSYEKVT